MVLLQSREINHKTPCTKEPRNRSNPSEHSAGADLQPLPLDRASPPLLGAHDVSDQHEAIAAAVAAVSEMVDERLQKMQTETADRPVGDRQIERGWRGAQRIERLAVIAEGDRRLAGLHPKGRLGPGRWRFPGRTMHGV